MRCIYFNINLSNNNDSIYSNSLFNTINNAVSDNILNNFDDEYSTLINLSEEIGDVEIGIKDLSEKNSVTVSINEPKKEFKYVIKIADFYYLESAKMLKKRL